MHVYLYYFVPDRPVTNSVPQGGVPVMSTGQELRFWGMDGQSPELISVTLQRTETNRSSLKYYSQHPGALRDHEPWLTAHSGISPICFSSSLTEAEEGDVSIKQEKSPLCNSVLCSTIAQNERVWWAGWAGAYLSDGCEVSGQCAL